MVPYAAYLRVYEPLSAFSPEDAARWSSYAESDGAADAVRAAEAEQQASLTAVLTGPQLAVAVHEHDGGYLFEGARELMVCPADVRLRSWLSFSALVEELGPVRLRALLPTVVLDQVDADFLAWRADNPEACPHVRQTRWKIPAAWYVIVSEDEQATYLSASAPAAENGGNGANAVPRTCLRYRTPMVQARRRIARAYAILSKAFASDADAVASVADLGRWLESFHPHAVVELDCAGLSGALSQWLEDGSDPCPGEIARALRALADGDLDAAGEHYERFTARWQAMGMLEHAN